MGEKKQLKPYQALLDSFPYLNFLTKKYNKYFKRVDELVNLHKYGDTMLIIMELIEIGQRYKIQKKKKDWG